MGLIHAASLERWEDWERSRHQARNAKHAAMRMLETVRRGGAVPEEPQRFTLHSRAGEGQGSSRILIAVDSASPTSRASLLTALPYLRSGIDVLTPAGIALAELASEDWDRTEVGADGAELSGRGIDAVATIGWHLRTGRLAHAWAAREQVASTVVQHGALTPFAPPLPPETTLFAWTDEDGDFYRSGRSDVDVRVIGSQLLWQAARDGVQGDAPSGVDDVVTGGDDRPVFLGQMHGAELPRRITAGAAIGFCRREHALYRPHPSEQDVLSRTIHRVMRKRGIEFQDTAIPLRELTNPVVAVFSTGVLEAAVRGVPAWVHAARAPRWVHEFWSRYRMARWGAAEPTRGPKMSADEPARLLAQHLEGVA